MALDAEQKAERERWRRRASHMRDLQAYAEWETYLVELEELEKAYTEQIVAGTDDHAFLRGKIHGLREACYRPAWIIEHTRRMNEE